MKDHLPLGSASPDRSASQQASFMQAEEEVIASPVISGPTEEELALLLGGKVLPPPPSATDDEFIPQPPTLPSPKVPLSRASSFSNLGFGTNLFSNALAKVAKPARDDDDDSEDSRDTSLPKIVTTSHTPAKKTSSRPSHAFNTSDTSSDEISGNDDSDDSEERAKKKEKSLVFPPPRPASEADRQRIYKAAMTPPSMTPKGSSSDLKAYIQVC